MSASDDLPGAGAVGLRRGNFPHEMNGPSLRRLSRRRGLLALLLLLATLSTVFWFGGERELFYRWHPHHNSISSQSLALAENLSPEHRFLGFFVQYGSLDGPPVYYPYNRFPVVNHALVKLAMLPFGDDLGAKIYAARMLMLAFFVAAGAMAWLSLRRLFSDEAAALVATLLAFSSARFLFYNDMVSMEIPSLFAVLLAFHGMTVFVQEGRFGQLLLKTGVAILLSLQIVSLVLAFTALGLGYELFRSVQERPPAQVWPPLWSRLVATLAASLYLRLGMAAALFFALVAGLPLFNEYMALGGSSAPSELLSIHSALRRTTGLDLQGLNGDSVKLEWPVFLSAQLTRIGLLLIPHAVFYLSPFELPYPHYVPIFGEPKTWFAVLGGGAIAVCILIAAGSRWRILTGTLLLSGWLWSLPVRAHAAFHDYDALFYVGIPLIFFAWAYLRAAAFLGSFRDAGGGRAAAASFAAVSVAAAVAIFCLSSFSMGKVARWPDGGSILSFSARPPDGDASFVKDAMADFQTIRQATEPGDRIFILFPGAVGSLDWDHQQAIVGASKGVYFYLSGRIIKAESEFSKWPADYVLSRKRIESPSLLTPGNRRLFLYDRKLLSGPDELRLSGQR